MTTRVFSHENLAIVHDAKNRLEAAGIDCEIKNEFHGGGGHVGLNIVPIELWVLRDELVDKAKGLLEDSEANEPVNGSEAKAQWACEACGELNEKVFAVCWKCQSNSPGQD